MIKVILQTLEGTCEIELKKDQEGCSMLVIMSKSEFLGESGRAWHGKSTDAAAVAEIAELIKECYANPSRPENITIADGMKVTFSLDVTGSKITFVLNSIDRGTNEFRLLTMLFAMTNAVVGDPVLKNYLEIFERYCHT